MQMFKLLETHAIVRQTTPNTEKPSYMSTHWIQKTESLLDGLFHLCTLHAAFQSFESLLSSGEMVGASASLSEMVNQSNSIFFMDFPVNFNYDRFRSQP
jgi:hypothetical protein